MTIDHVVDRPQTDASSRRASQSGLGTSTPETNPPHGIEWTSNRVVDAGKARVSRVADSRASKSRAGGRYSRRLRARVRRAEPVGAVRRDLDLEHRLGRKISEIGAPMRVSGGRMSRPCASSASASSFALHIMPSLSTPRSLPTLILKSRAAPRRAARAAPCRRSCSSSRRRRSGADVRCRR